MLEDHPVNQTRSETVEDLRHRVAGLVASGELTSVGIGASDFSGIYRGKNIPASVFLEAVSSPIRIADMFFALDPGEGVTVNGPPEGWWPLSDRGFREMLCMTVPESFRLVPWRRGWGLALCDFVFSDGTTVGAAPRQVLRRIVERAAGIGLVAKVGYELEFIVFTETDESLRAKGYRDLQTLAGHAQTWGMVRSGVEDVFLAVLRDGLSGFGIPVEAWSVEGAQGQYEINVPYSEAMEAADRAFLHRFAVKELAARNHLLATFMARVPGSRYGSSFHLHQSLWDGAGTNAMHDPACADGLSDTARHFIAGQLACQYELACLFAPTVNSYKRLLPGMSAGANATWGIENWSAALRVLTSPAQAARVELRTPGADANPYLAIAAGIAAGLYGIEHKLDPPPPIRGDATQVPGAAEMPRSLGEAIVALRESAMAREYFGDEFVDVFVATRQAELDAFQQTVTDWEAARYLVSL
jgi:glutamine synthetase